MVCGSTVDDDVVMFMGMAEMKSPGGNLRRNSTRHFNPSTIGEKVLPHYLRPSTGSCHDFCKHGKKQEMEAKTWEPLRRTNSTPPLGHRGRIMINKPVSAEMKRSMSCKLKPVANNRRASAESTKALQIDVISAATSFGVGLNEASVNAKNSGGSMRSGIISNPMPVKKKPIPSPSGGGPNVVTLKNRLHPGRAENIGGMGSVGIDKELDSLRKQNARKIQPVTSQSLSSQHPAGGVNGSTNGKVEATKQTRNTIALVAVKKVLLSPMVPLSPKRSVIRLSSLNDQNLGVLDKMQDEENKKKVNNEPECEPVYEKTLYVIKVEAESLNLSSEEINSATMQQSDIPTTVSMPEKEISSISEISLSLSPPKSLCSPRSPSWPSHLAGNSKELGYAPCQEKNCILENAETLALNGTETSENVEQKSMLRKSVIMSSNVNGNGNMKLKFRKGKVVDLEAHNENQQRLFGKREVDDNVSDRTAGAEKIALRHQDLQPSKDEEGLLNNVIEQTARKLENANRSKVKALVDAFETLISLQDRKLSRATIA